MSSGAKWLLDLGPGDIAARLSARELRTRGVATIATTTRRGHRELVATGATPRLTTPWSAYAPTVVTLPDGTIHAETRFTRLTGKSPILLAGMPEDLRRERDAPRVILRVEEKVADMRAKGASDDDIYRMRAKEFSPEAAARLADLDREEAEWKRRIGNYLSERSQLLQAQANAPEADRHMALMKLQQAQFSEDERRRLPAYEP